MPTESRSPLVLIGGVGELFQGDLDLGRVAAERLQAEDLGEHVLVEDFHYGAVAVAQRIQELKPAHLVLIGGIVRGRAPASVTRALVDGSAFDPADMQLAVGDAVTGYVSIDLVVEVAAGLGVLPGRTVTVEVEPASVELCDHLSAQVVDVLDEVLDLVRAEVRRAPLLDIADQIRRRLEAESDRLGESPAAETLLELVESIRSLGEHGRWGRVFVQRERLRRQLDAGETGEGMDTLDWALWWALLEELDKVFGAEAGSS
ncbi:MAG: hypothetical protein ACR2MO_01005 [Acidimicrobiales bacterium]